MQHLYIFDSNDAFLGRENESYLSRYAISFPIPSRRIYISAAAFFVTLPAVVFYSIVLGHVVNLPMFDDYYALLGFLNDLTAAPTSSAKLHYFLICQNNEYKLFFEHALSWLQFGLSGHIDLKLLSIIGDSFVLWLAILLWKMFLPRHGDLVTRLTLFIPVSLLLFQLQYAQTLNFAMATLQNLPVLVFSLATIYLLLQMTTRAFCGALACLVLSVSSSANGLLMIAIGALILAMDRKDARLWVWAATSCLCLASYFHGYNTRLWLNPPRFSISSLTQLWKPASFMLCFLGSVGGYPFKAGSLIVGLISCVFYVYVTRKGHFRKNRVVGYSVCFLILTAVGVAGIRSHFPVSAAVSSRYTIYSTLLVIFAWFVVVEEWLVDKQPSIRRDRVFATAVVAAIFFCAAMDVWGWRFLVRRNLNLAVGMTLYKHHPQAPSTLGPVFPPPQSADGQEFNRRARDILARSAQLGLYRPPTIYGF